MASFLLPVVIGSYLILKIKPSQLTGEVTYVKSDIDNKSYLVQNKKDSKEGANTLAQINQRLTKLKEYLASNKSKYPEFDKPISLVTLRFNGNNITEGNLNYDYTTYTVNKGQEINFCLRTRNENDQIHDINLLTFVAIHELAHIASVQNDPGHKTDEFKRNFEFLLKRAIEIGVYNYVDYAAAPVMYCGTLVNSTPV